MPRSAAWQNRSCAIVRPETSSVVCARCVAVNSRGSGSNHCFTCSVGRPRRARSSCSNASSCFSIASSESESRSTSPLFLLSVEFIWVLLVLVSLLANLGKGGTTLRRLLRRLGRFRRRQLREGGGERLRLRAQRRELRVHVLVDATRRRE